MNYKIAEIFSSIQGEGLNSGQASIFVRFSGCNLKCSFCDTDHSEKLVLNEYQLVEHLLSFPTFFGSNLVLTGGEPAKQDLWLFLKEIRPFVQRRICLETNGLFYKADTFDKIDFITVSPKTPLHTITIPFKKIDEIKIIVTQNTTIDNILPYILKGIKRIYLQPESNNLDLAKRCLSFISSYPFDLRLSLQLQKILNIR